MAAKPPDLDSLLDCPICLSECEDPRVLTCLHTLCLKCLDQHINKSAQGKNFLCPSCRHKCEVPAGGVTSVPKNFFLNSLKAILQHQGSREKLSVSSKVSAKATQQKCSNSGKGDTPCGEATVFCVECAEFYCSDCKSYHAKFVKESSTHQLVPVSSADASFIKAAVSRRTTPKCDQHFTLPTDMYCDNCRVPVCMKCCLLEHKEHAYREIERAAADSRGLLSDLTQTAENIASRLNKNLQELDVSEKKINTDCEEACRQVQENAKEIRALVTKKEKSAVQEIRQAQITSLTQLKAAYKEAEINKAAVESLLSYIQALLVSEDVTSQVVHAPGVQEQLRQHKVAPLQSVTLEVNLERKIQSLSALSAMLGAVSVQQTAPASSSLGGANPEDMKVPLGSPLTELTPDIKSNVSGIVMIGDCVGVTAFGYPHLWIYNTKTNTHKRHTIDGLQSVGLTLVQSDTLVITDRTKKLHLIKIGQQMSITEHVVKNLSFVPESVSVDSVNGKLVVANNTDKSIAICGTQSDVENQVKVKTSISYLMGALGTNDGYVVADYGQHKLHWLSKVGDVIHTYGESLSYPIDIIQDSQGRVIVVDQNHHRLHLVDANRNLSHYLLTEKDGIRYPTCVYLDEVNARVLVGYRDTNHTRKVRVYNWPFVTQYGAHASLRHKLCVKLPRFK